MPKYEVTAPDGRKFRISGDSAPNEQQLNEIFAGVSIGNGQSMPQVQLPTMPQMTDEQKVSAAQMAEQIKPKREGITLRDIGDIALSTGKGIVSGAESAVNGGTFGAYDWLDRKLGLGAEKRKEELQQQAERGGVGGANKVMQFAAEMGGNIAGGGGALYKGLQKAGLSGLKLATTTGAIEGGTYGLTASNRLNEIAPNMVVGSALGAIGGGVGDKVLAPVLGKVANIGVNVGSKAASIASKGIGKVGKLINDIEVKRGLGQLVDVLEKGEGFKDIKFGKLTADKIDDINAIRSASSQPLMSGERLIIPANVQKKWVEKRIKNDGLSPKELGEMLRDVFHTKTVKISPTKLSQNQALIDLQDDLANIGFVSVNPANKQSVVKSAYKTAVDNVENVLFGKKNPPRETPNPLIDNQIKPELGSHGRLTDHSAGNKNAKEGRPIPSYGRDLTHPAGQRFSGPQSDKSIISQNSSVVNNLAEAMADEQKVRALRRGVQASDEIAQKVKREATDVALHLNNEMKAWLDKASGRSIDTAKALANQGEKYQKTILQQGKFKTTMLAPEGRIANPTSFQKKMAKKAMEEASDVTNYPKGTVAHANQIKQALNAMEKKAVAQQWSNTKIQQIKALQEQINGVLKSNSTIKLRDARWAKAKKIDDAYEAGRSFTGKSLTEPLIDPLERQAFLKGFIERLKKGTPETKNLAKFVDDNRSVLKELMPSNKYHQLRQMIDDINNRYGRVGALGSRAETKLNTPLVDSFFGREVLESKGSMMGHLLDRMVGEMSRRGSVKNAKQVFDGTFDQIRKTMEASRAKELGRLLGAYAGGKMVSRVDR